MFKLIHHYIRGRWERYYLKSHWHLILDLSLSLLVVILAGALFSLYYYRPNLPWLGSYNPPTVDLNNPPLEIDYSVATSSAKIQDGTILRIIFKNNGNAAINNVNIDFATADDNFALSRLELDDNDNGNLSLNGRELVLKQIKAGTSSALTLRIYFSQKNLAARKIEWQAQSQYFFAGQLLKATVKLAPLTTAAELIAKEAAYYTSPQGDQLGIGPIPPIVGIPTNYWVFLETSGSSDFKDIVFSAYLPQGVELSSGRSLLAGEFSYSTSSRQIIWKIPELKSGNGSYRLGFEIQLIPTAEQEGKVLPLLTNTRYYGEDALTGDEVGGRLKQLTTDLESDRFNSGQGQVVKP